MSQRPHWDLAERVSQKTGIPTEFIWGQWAHETGGFTSALTAENNLAGLTQTTANDMAQPDGSLHYMRFNSKEEFADYYANYIGLYKEDGIFEAKTRAEFASALKRGGYFGDSVENYVAGMDNALGDSFFSGSPIASAGYNAWGFEKPTVPKTIEPETKSAWEQTQDKFLDSWFDSSVIGAGRLAWKNIQSNDLTSRQNYEITQEDIDYVTKELDGDYTARMFVLLNASGKNNLALLTQMKKEDIERRRRVENYDWGVSTLGTIGGALLDPINLIPFAGGAAKGVGLGTKVLSRLGGYAPTIDKLVRAGTRYGATFGSYGTLNTADRYLAEKASGYEQDYTSAFLIGGTFGTLAPAALKGLQHMAGYGNKGAQKIVGALDNMETHGVSQAMDAALPNARKVSFETAKSFHDVSFIEKYKAGSKYLTELAEGNKVFAVTRKQANELGTLLKTRIPKGAKAFYNEAEDYTVLISDNIKAGHPLITFLLMKSESMQAYVKTLGTKFTKTSKQQLKRKWKSQLKNGKKL